MSITLDIYRQEIIGPNLIKDLTSYIRIGYFEAPRRAAPR